MRSAYDDDDNDVVVVVVVVVVVDDADGASHAVCVWCVCVIAI